MALEIRKYKSADGLTLYYRRWLDGTHPDAIIYLHGIESHSGWFAECADDVARMGAAVYAPDRRGAGLNRQLRGHCGSFHQLVEDVIACLDMVKGMHEHVHLAALSWGGKLAVAVDMLYPGSFSTTTLIAPGIFPRVTPTIGRMISIAIDSFIRPQALHPIPIRDDMFTSVNKHLEYIAEDPLRLRMVTAGFYRESFRLDRFLKKRAYQWSSPTQLLLAEHDVIIDNERLRVLFNSLKAEPKRMHVYEGCNHSLQFERAGEVAKDIVSWMHFAGAGGQGAIGIRDDD